MSGIKADLPSWQVAEDFYRLSSLSQHKLIKVSLNLTRFWVKVRQSKQMCHACEDGSEGGSYAYEDGYKGRSYIWPSDSDTENEDSDVEEDWESDDEENQELRHKSNKDTPEDYWESLFSILVKSDSPKEIEVVVDGNKSSGNRHAVDNIFPTFVSSLMDELQDFPILEKISVTAPSVVTLKAGIESGPESASFQISDNTKDSEEFHLLESPKNLDG